ncbi:hypothetical protein [uncultured Brevundimonas sp.]|uniref:hypothetical protein n=1 Tax=uncultured Brevundimonas sp. TaxID=213418 RepID=UPI0025D22850|nr:hypothetical protein [uncultured Brevundimonas sp.]
MVALHFDWFGYSFQTGLGVLRSSMLAARDALSANVEIAQEEAVGYQERVRAGVEEAQIDYDDAGYVILDHQDILNWNVQVAEDAEMALRKAFVLAVYHHWERSARKWTESAHGKHDALEKLTLTKGYPIDPKLGAVRDLVNLLKHANSVWAKRLMSSWPAVFYPDVQPLPLLDWYEAVNLTDPIVDEIFEIISKSGPVSTLAD